MIEKLFHAIGYGLMAVPIRVWNVLRGHDERMLAIISMAFWMVFSALTIFWLQPWHWLSQQAAGGLAKLWPLAVLDVLAWGLFEGVMDKDASHKRGAEIVSAGALRRRIGKASDLHLRLGGVPIPYDLEPLNFLMAGSPGSGKSQAINGLLDPLRNRGDRVMMADVGGEAMASWWRDGDLLLNVFDSRTQDWSPFAEMEGPWDALMVAKAIVPDKEGPNAEWAIYAQAFIEAVAAGLWRRGDATNEKFLHFLTIANAAEVFPFVAGTPAQALFDEGSSKMLSNVRAIVGTALMPYRFLNPAAGKDGFSVRRWVRDGEGWLWVPYRADMQDALAPLIACWVGVLTTTTLSLKSELTRRLWLIMDEFAALGRIQGIEAAFDKGRKKGLCIITGLQTVAQLQRSYGPKGAQIIMACLGNKLLLRTEDAETARYLSDTLGERERPREEKSESKNDNGSSTTIAHRIVNERAVLPSQIQNLGKLTGYLKLAGLPSAPVKIPIVHKPEVIEPFVQKELSAPAKPEAPAVQADTTSKEQVIVTETGAAAETISLEDLH